MPRRIIVLEHHKREPKQPQSSSGRFKDIALGSAGLISSVAIPAVGLLLAHIQKDKEVSLANTQKNQELEKGYVELGIRILSDPPKPESQELRKWAVKLINAHTQIQLDGKAASAVISEIPLSESPRAKNTTTGLAFQRLGQALIASEDLPFAIDYDGVDGRKLDPLNGADNTGLRYPDGGPLDARKVPYVSVPRPNFREEKIAFGDYAIVFNTTNGQQAFAVVGDQGTNKSTLDISPALADSLGVKYSKYSVGADKLVCVVFPGSANGLWPDSLREQASKLYQDWGGDAAIRPYLKPDK